MIFASTACLGAPDLWFALAAFRDAGIERVELGTCRLADADDLANRLGRHGAEYLVHNYFPPPPTPFVLNLASPDDGNRDRSIEHATSAIELAAEIGSGLYSVHAGFALDPVGYDGGRFVFAGTAIEKDRAAAMDRFTLAIGDLLAHAERRSVRLLVENNVCVPEHRGLLLLQEGAELRTFFDEFASPSLGLLLDTGHLLVSAETLGFDADEFVAAVKPWVGAFHASQNDGRRDSHDPVTLDGWVASTLARPVFAGLPICVEARFESADQAARHVVELGELLERRSE